MQLRLVGGSTAGLLVGVLLPGPLLARLALAVAVGSMVFVGLGQVVSTAEGRDQARSVQQLPEVLDLMASALDAGLPLRGAAAEAARIGPQPASAAVAKVTSQVGIGIDEAQAWLALAEDPVWGEVAHDLASSAATGAAAAQVLRGHADDARARRQEAVVKRARTVGVRSVLPLMACFLPAFLLTGVVPIIAGLVQQFTLR
ncbi:type II secretion system F family protein [Luteococcus sp. OSA5]|uniref:type II secretion system F family protein n=1 Tax=Luteococcus sp. OSA5 TaxID=3401630 RepID=UPI003B432093